LNDHNQILLTLRSFVATKITELSLLSTGMLPSVPLPPLVDIVPYVDLW
jgi:hypothetical protein